ncbi:MAG: glycosyltransferase family 2 protein [Gammaproteobacteria bacterium]|nr:glycosyltransferase family 2 protein [Gammaproteobacteria bacterium]NNJ83792.1 glycosyltransferase family 2 protein [Gammaproteobacteria bacterium]
MMALSNQDSINNADRKLLSVVTPCYNESEVIGLFYKELVSVLHSLSGSSGKMDFEMIFVDDGSRDDTLRQLNRIAETDPAVRVYSLSRNFGHQIALTAGLDFAVGDAVVLMDADLQHPPASIPDLVEKWSEGYDVVAAVRNNTQRTSRFKDFTSNSFYSIFNFLSTTQIPRGAGDFCLLSRRVCTSLQNMPERHRFLRGMVSWTGYERALVPYECAKRAAGRSKYSWRKMIGLAMDAVFSFSAQPLRLALRLGLTMTVLGFVYLFWTLLAGLLNGNLVPGYASLIGVMITLGGFQLAFIGLIGEYLARVFEEVKGRPIYSIKQMPRESTVSTKSKASTA